MYPQNKTSQFPSRGWHLWVLHVRHICWGSPESQKAASGFHPQSHFGWCHEDCNTLSAAPQNLSSYRGLLVDFSARWSGNNCGNASYVAGGMLVKAKSLRECL